MVQSFILCDFLIFSYVRKIWDPWVVQWFSACLWPRVILETRDRIPRRAPSAWSLLLPLPVSLCAWSLLLPLPASLSLSLSVCVCDY